MKTARMMTMMAVAAATVYAGEQKARTIDVYVADHRHANRPLGMAEQYTNGIFASVNLGVRWHSGKAPAAPGPLTLAIDLVDLAPDNVKPCALAFALPYEGVHITVFYDRVLAMDKSFPDAVLGHVLAHEIAHLLEGVVRHSVTGVMKATYTRKDTLAMRSTPLAFTATDIDLIDAGVTGRLLHRAGLDTRGITASVAAEEPR